jgi:phage tail sheath protein FI
VDEAATTANVIGTTTAAGLKTGLQALLSAQAMLGVKPRIIGAPGLATQAVVTALSTVAQKLRAMAYAYCDGCDTLAQAITYRNQFSARELMLLWPNYIRFDTATAANVEAYSEAYALGLRAAIDRDTGWHKTLSNVAVNGVVGITKPVFWDLQQERTDADLLNAAGITTLVNHNGYRFWGSRTCDDEGLFFFESYTRTAQILADTMAEAHMWANDKPLHPSLAKDIIECQRQAAQPQGRGLHPGRQGLAGRIGQHQRHAQERQAASTTTTPRCRRWKTSPSASASPTPTGPTSPAAWRLEPWAIPP